jgi:pimeloyl-ACP methyl ester carboxylesterase
MWRGFPAQVARATGLSAVVYSRRGYGRSEPLTGPRGCSLHARRSARRASRVPGSARNRCPILIGHSDGGSIALIHAGGAQRPLVGVVTLAAHVLVEDLSVSSIAAARQEFETTDMRKKLARHHADVDSVFWSWNRIWLAPEFRGWNIEEYLPVITCPVLAIQGEDDEYGTMEQMRRIGAKVANVELVMLPDCRSFGAQGPARRRDRGHHRLRRPCRWIAEARRTECRVPR